VGEEEPKVEVAACYPAFVADDDASRRRYDLALAIAIRIMDEPPEGRHARFAAARLYHSNAPT
jgi:hypothetical protein